MDVSIRIEDSSVPLDEAIRTCQLAGADGIVMTMASIRSPAHADRHGETGRRSALAIEVPLVEDVLPSLDRAGELEPSRIVLVPANHEQSVIPRSTLHDLQRAATLLGRAIQHLAARETTTTMRVLPDRGEVEFAHAFGADGIRLDVAAPSHPTEPFTPVRSAAVRAHELGLAVEVSVPSFAQARAACAIRPIDSLVIGAQAKELADPARFARALAELRDE